MTNDKINKTIDPDMLYTRRRLSQLYNLDVRTVTKILDDWPEDGMLNNYYAYFPATFEKCREHYNWDMWNRQEERDKQSAINRQNARLRRRHNRYRR